MTVKTVTVRLEAQTSAYQAAMARASATTSEFARNIAGVGEASDRHIERIGKAALVAAGGLAAGLGLSMKAAIDWESAWAGVTKTVDGSAEEMAALQQGLRDMSKELPATHAEIAGVAEAAGQLGISVGGIEKFTDTMIDLGETTNLTAEEAAIALARFGNIMGTAEGDVERMGSTIVELGNNFATTEAEILQMSTRLAAAGKIAGLSEADIFAFAATLSSVGVEAEAGGTAVSKVFTSIRDAVLAGNEDLETFARVAGVTAQEFSAAFRDDAAEAIAMFITGLGQMNDSGQSTTQVFEDLELADQRLMRALLSTAGAGDLLTDALGMASDAWEENTALQAEAEQRYKTTAAQLEIARNKIVDLGIDIGQVLVPALNSGLDLFGSFVDGLAAMPGPMKAATVGLAGISTAMLGGIGIIGTLGPKVREFKASLDSMGRAGQFASRNLGTLTVAGGGIMAVLGTLTLAMGENARQAAENRQEIESWIAAIRSAGDVAAGTLQYVTDVVTSSPELSKWMAENKLTVDDLVLALTEGGAAWDKFASGRDAFTSGSLAVTAALNGLETRFEAVTDENENLNRVLRDSEGSATTLGGALGELAGKSKSADGAAEGLTAAMEDQEAAAKALDDAIKRVHDGINSLIGVNLSADEVMSRLQAGLDNLTESVKEHGATLDITSEAGRANRDVVRGYASDLFERMIPALMEQERSTKEVTKLVNLHVAALRDTMLQADFTKDQIDALNREYGLTPDNIETLIKLLGDAEAKRKLKDVTEPRNVDIHARTWGFDKVAMKLAQLTGNRTVSIFGQFFGTPPRQWGQRHGGINEFAAGGVTAYAAGGIHAHVARGDVIRYAEPETGGEAFIPRFGDPSRSMAILNEAASWYGATVVDDLASWSRSQHGQQSMSAGQMGPVPVQVSFDTSGLPSDLASMLRKRVQIEAGGDSQRFWGGR